MGQHSEPPYPGFLLDHGWGFGALRRYRSPDTSGRHDRLPGLPPSHLCMACNSAITRTRRFLAMADRVPSQVSANPDAGVCQPCSNRPTLPIAEPESREAVHRRHDSKCGFETRVKAISLSAKGEVSGMSLILSALRYFQPPFRVPWPEHPVPSVVVRYPGISLCHVPPHTAKLPRELPVQHRTRETLKSRKTYG